MKKIYQAPTLEIEAYELDANIAGSCGDHKVDFGPGIVQSNGSLASVCDYFKSDWEDPFAVATVDLTPTSFYETGTACTCYYTAGGEGYFTS